MSLQLSESDWALIDPDIFASQKVRALQAVIAATGLSLPIALRLLTERYNHLRQCQPERFTTGHDRYWDGFHS